MTDNNTLSDETTIVAHKRDSTSPFLIVSRTQTILWPSERT
jgi:hypothetical protein